MDTLVNCTLNLLEPFAMNLGNGVLLFLESSQTWYQWHGDLERAVFYIVAIFWLGIFERCLHLLDRLDDAMRLFS